MITSIISRLVILVFGTLYPAYASYKAVKTRNAKEHVKWMMYWIVFALFTCAETFTDIFLSWIPFYYELKIIIVIYLLSPATSGSKFLYTKFIHPAVSSREQDIDEYITKAKEQGYKQFLDLGTKGVSALMQTALKSGGGIVNQLKKSYSLSDLSGTLEDHDETDVVITDPRLIRSRVQRSQRSPSRSTSASSSLYFQEVDVVRNDRIAHVQSVEDVSSGYSSSECVVLGQGSGSKSQSLVRSSSLTRAHKSTRVTRSSSKKPSVSDESDENEVFDTNIVFLNDKALPIASASHQPKSESSEEEFVDSVDTLHEIDQSRPEPQLKGVIINKPSGVETSKLTACNSPSPPDGAPPVIRGGKYHKKVAPPPPVTEQAAIKATLVLKPGLVKPLKTSTNSERKEIFVQGPKAKRRHANLIPSSSSFLSASSSSLGKLIHFPKKIGFWNNGSSNNKEKRGSWHEFLHSSNSLALVANSKIQSRSDNNLTKPDSSTESRHKLERSSSRCSIRSLTESPLAKRRLKIIRRYVDEDID